MHHHAALDAADNRDQTLGLEDAERFPQRWSRHAEALDQFRLVTEGVPLVQFAENDQPAQLVGDLLRLLPGLRPRARQGRLGVLGRHIKARIQRVDQPACTNGKERMSSSDNRIFFMGTPRRAGMQRFGGPADARLLHATQMMSMPTMDPPAPAELIEWATASSQVVKVLFGDPESGGMSLVWSWFAPHFPLPRHSHSADCLYYVSKGELHMGNLVVKEGEGFFVPSGAPYAYTAGPDGVEVLEFPRREPVRHADHREPAPMGEDGGGGPRAPRGLGRGTPLPPVGPRDPRGPRQADPVTCRWRRFACAKDLDLELKSSRRII